jgi:hypothetical protein
MTDPATAVDVPGPPGPHRLDGHHVVLYPEHLDGDRGSYSLSAAGFVDELTGEGVEVQPYHDLAHSDWTGERDPLWLSLILGVASSAAWDAIKRLLGRRSRNVKVTVGFQQGDQIRWVQAEGDGRAVAAALDRLNPWR